MAKKMPFITVKDPTGMSPAQRDAAEKASIVRDLSAVPPAYRERVQQRMTEAAVRDRPGS